jgi:hypothetical protein
MLGASLIAEVQSSRLKKFNCSVQNLLNLEPGTLNYAAVQLDSLHRQGYKKNLDLKYKS